MVIVFGAPVSPLLRFDGDGRLRLVAPGPAFAEIVDTAFSQIRQSARSNPVAAIRMLEAIAQIAGRILRTEDAAKRAQSKP